jgi:hypothetical protein
LVGYIWDRIRSLGDYFSLLFPHQRKIDEQNNESDIKIEEEEQEEGAD